MKAHKKGEYFARECEREGKREHLYHTTDDDELNNLPLEFQSSRASRLVHI